MFQKAVFLKLYLQKTYKHAYMVTVSDFLIQYVIRKAKTRF